MNHFILKFSNDEYGSENGNEQGFEEEPTVLGRSRVETSDENTEDDEFQETTIATRDDKSVVTEVEGNEVNGGSNFVPDSIP
mgnify:CR=1 FL=1